MFRKSLILMPLLLVVLVAACSDDGDENPTGPGGGGNGDTISFAGQIRPIITTRCATIICHGSMPGTGNLFMGSGSWAEMINASGNNGRIIEPGNSIASPLYTKTTSTPPFGGRMPEGGPFLSLDQQEAIMKWIEQGALDN